MTAQHVQPMAARGKQLHQSPPDETEAP